jgi:hypothetical protein
MGYTGYSPPDPKLVRSFTWVIRYLRTRDHPMHMRNSLTVWALRMTTTGVAVVRSARHTTVAPTIHGLRGYVDMPPGLPSVHKHPAFYGRWFYRSIKDTKGEKE